MSIQLHSTQLHSMQTQRIVFNHGQEATNLRKQAEHMPHGIRRDDILRQAIQLDGTAEAHK